MPTAKTRVWVPTTTTSQNNVPAAAQQETEVFTGGAAAPGGGIMTSGISSTSCSIFSARSSCNYPLSSHTTTRTNDHTKWWCSSKNSSRSSTSMIAADHAGDHNGRGSATAAAAPVEEASYTTGGSNHGDRRRGNQSKNKSPPLQHLEVASPENANNKNKQETTSCYPSSKEEKPTTRVSPAETRRTAPAGFMQGQIRNSKKEIAVKTTISTTATMRTTTKMSVKAVDAGAITPKTRNHRNCLYKGLESMHIKGILQIRDSASLSGPSWRTISTFVDAGGKNSKSIFGCKIPTKLNNIGAVVKKPSIRRCPCKQHQETTKFQAGKKKRIKLLTEYRTGKNSSKNKLLEGRIMKNRAPHVAKAYFSQNKNNRITGTPVDDDHWAFILSTIQNGLGFKEFGADVPKSSSLPTRLKYVFGGKVGGLPTCPCKQGKRNIHPKTIDEEKEGRKRRKLDSGAEAKAIEIAGSTELETNFHHPPAIPPYLPLENEHLSIPSPLCPCCPPSSHTILEPLQTPMPMQLRPPFYFTGSQMISFVRPSAIEDAPPSKISSDPYHSSPSHQQGKTVSAPGAASSEGVTPALSPILPEYE